MRGKPKVVPCAFLLAALLAWNPPTRAAEVTVRVESLAGQPIAEAEVCLLPNEEAPRADFVQTTGSRDGEVTFFDVDPGDYSVVVSREGTAGGAQGIQLTIGGTFVSFSLKPGDPEDGPLCRIPPVVTELTINRGSGTVLPLTLSTIAFSTSATMLAPMEFRTADVGLMDATPWLPVPANLGSNLYPEYEAQLFLGGEPGEHTFGLQVRFAEAPELESPPVTSTVTVGEPAVMWLPVPDEPTIESFELNGGAVATNLSNVTLRWTTGYTGGEALEYRAKEGAGIEAAAWQPAPPAQGWMHQPSYVAHLQLQPGEPNTVTLQLRYAGDDDPERWATAEDDIKFVTATPVPPVLLVGGFAIDGGAATTDSRTVTLSWTSQTGLPTEYRVREGTGWDDCSGAGWEPATASGGESFLLARGPAGTRTLHAQFRIEDEPSSCVQESDSIELESEVYEIDGGVAGAFAMYNGWGFRKTTPPLGLHDIDCVISTITEGWGILLYTDNWSPAPFTCEFELFADYQLTDGWTFHGYSGSAGYCDAGEIDVDPPASGSPWPRFDIELTAPAASGIWPTWSQVSKTACNYDLEEIELRGPADSEWTDAFMHFTGD